MTKGGYQIIDLKGMPIEVGGTKIDGVYSAINRTEGKPFLFSGINFGDGVLKDRYVTLEKGDTSYFGQLDASHVIYIDGDDTVEIVSELSVPIATKTTLGVVMVGTNVSATADGKLSVPTGSKTARGVLTVGDNLNVDSSGTIAVPFASTASAGVIKVGAGLTISDDGVLSVSGS